MAEDYGKLIPMETDSRPNWTGVHPEKFRYAERKHYESRDQMVGIHGNDLPILGRKHYQPKYGNAMDERFTVKVFPDKQNKQSDWSEQVTLKKMAYIPPQKRYGHKEKLHLTQNPAQQYNYKPQVKTFEHANIGSTKELNLEQNMGQKKIIASVDEQRNGLDYRSMGDKPYKNPEYASNFYKEGGLVAGSTIQKRKNKPGEISYQNKQKGPLFPGRLTWKEKEQIDQKTDEVKCVQELFDWEKQTLKEANPKWRDPDEVNLDDLPKAEDKHSKDIKKTGKK